MHVIIVESDLNLRATRVKSLPGTSEYKGASISFVSTAAAAINELNDRKRQTVRILANNVLHTRDEYVVWADREKRRLKRI